MTPNTTNKREDTLVWVLDQETRNYVVLSSSTYAEMRKKKLEGSYSC